MERGVLLFFFFFQAEDGIRDLYVTGVQTCALPIWPARTPKGCGDAWPRCALGKVLALSPRGRSLGAISALGIRGHRPRPQGLTGKRLGTHSQSSQASLEQAVCR